jgi:O-antigen/teichoic acid export membrane protein
VARTLRQVRPTPADASPSLGGAAALNAALRGSALRVVGFALGLVVSAGGAAILFRHLGVADAGAYVLVISVVTVAGGLADGGLSMLAPTELAVTPGESRAEIVRSLLGARLVLSALGVAIALGYGWVARFDRTLVLGVIIVGLATSLQAITVLLSSVLQTDLRYGVVTASELTRQVVTALAFGLIAALGGGIYWMFGALVAGAGAGLFLTRVGIAEARLLTPKLDLPRLRRQTRMLGAFAVTAAVGVLYFRLGIIVLARVSGERDVGLYALSFRVVEVLATVPALLVTAMLPLMSYRAADAHGFREVLQVAFRVSVGAGGAIALVLMAEASRVVAVVGGSA